MRFLIADSFSGALSKLTAQEQKAVKITVFDLQQDPSAPGLKFHRIDKSKDPNFWSIRANRDIRIIVHKTDASFLVAYVDHHDDAYAWAERRRIDTHPRTGAAQIVEVRERFEDALVYTQLTDTPDFAVADSASPAVHPFEALGADDILSLGVPQDWVEDIRGASEDQFLDLANHLPGEAAEALLDFVSTGVLRQAEPVVHAQTPFEHPDALRRFRVLEDVDELEQALDYPWEKWILYLHPTQRRVVERDFNGPARVSGSAGTGKTVVALHRVKHILDEDTDARPLLTTFSEPLANSLSHKLRRLVGAKADRVSILSFRGLARDLFTLINAHDPRPATEERVYAAIAQAAEEKGDGRFSHRFLVSEWRHVVDAWQIDSSETYATVPRLGRKNRLGTKQRERLWPIFARATDILAAQGAQTWPSIFKEVADHFRPSDRKPFTHIVVDEAQDLGVPELRLLSAIATPGENRLFFAGDLGQRIFQEPFSWKQLGIDIRGRSATLKVNYRTSHQIRQTVDKLLPPEIRDVDGNLEERKGTVSVFNGPAPEVVLARDENGEIDMVRRWVGGLLQDGLAPEEIGLFVRSDASLYRPRDVARLLGLNVVELSEKVEDHTGRLPMATMHLAKGLEFKAVAVMACDEGLLPDEERLSAAPDEIEQQTIYDTERHLLYVACTRARDYLLVTGIDPGSEFLEDLET